MQIISLVLASWLTSSPATSMASLRRWLERPRITSLANYTVQIVIKTMAANTIRSDSGSLTIGEKGCSKLALDVSRTIIISCRDTAWIRTSDGKVQAMPATALGGGESFQVPALAQLLRGVDYRLDRKLSNGDWVLAFEKNLPTGQSIPVKLTITPGTWLLHKMTMPSPNGEIETAYLYTTFHGKKILAEVDVVSGHLGIQRIFFTKYRKIAPPADAIFRFN